MNKKAMGFTVIFNIILIEYRHVNEIYLLNWEIMLETLAIYIGFNMIFSRNKK